MWNLIGKGGKFKNFKVTSLNSNSLGQGFFNFKKTSSFIWRLAELKKSSPILKAINTLYFQPETKKIVHETERENEKICSRKKCI